MVGMSKQNESKMSLQQEKEGKINKYYFRKCVSCTTRFLTDKPFILWCSNKCLEQDDSEHKKYDVDPHILTVLNDRTNGNTKTYSITAVNENEAVNKFIKHLETFFKDSQQYRTKIVSVQPTNKREFIIEYVLGD